MKIPVFCIVVGHTEAAPGAAGGWPIDKQHEYEFNDDLAIEIAFEILKGGGKPVIVHRDQGGIGGAYTKVNRVGPVACVELHFNAFNGTVQGTETLYTKNHRKSSDLAEMLQTGMVAALGRPDDEDRGARQIGSGDRGHQNLVRAKCPAAIVEPFFGDNLDDTFLGFKYKADLARFIAAAMLGFSKAKCRAL